MAPAPPEGPANGVRRAKRYPGDDVVAAALWRIVHAANVPNKAAVERGWDVGVEEDQAAAGE